MRCQICGRAITSLERLAIYPHHNILCLFCFRDILPREQDKHPHMHAQLHPQPAYTQIEDLGPPLQGEES
jgi:hypothetical protein